MLPMLAAAGGIAVPALIHFVFNGGTVTQGASVSRWRPISRSRLVCLSTRQYAHLY
ncbi:hypothetical protein [Massilia phyllosphaerae]|uniref:hypothetical protein n=1 Tax=Massilia phyllosphaerae TaxID=3106034 RepID=UPI002B1CCA15|nr:hypothetical protein [Massilia sp. SGZ-792]